MREGSTFEVAPHHLFLSYENARDAADTHMRMNPPLRTEAERKNLYAAFDKISAIASDHAPHTLAEKSAEFASAPSGIPGVETMLPLLMNEVHAGRLTLTARFPFRTERSRIGSRLLPFMCTRLRIPFPI